MNTPAVQFSGSALQMLRIVIGIEGKEKGGMPKKKFAELLNVDYATLCNWEAGCGSPTGTSLPLLFALLDAKGILSRPEFGAQHIDPSEFHSTQAGFQIAKHDPQKKSASRILAIAEEQQMKQARGLARLFSGTTISPKSILPGPGSSTGV